MDEIVSEIRKLRESGHGGIHECKKLVAGRILREQLQNANTLDEVKGVVLELINTNFKPYPTE